jgi:hypothetical protein
VSWGWLETASGLRAVDLAQEQPEVWRVGDIRIRQCTRCPWQEVLYDPLPDPDEVLPHPRRYLGPMLHYCGRDDGVVFVRWPGVEPDEGDSDG